MRFTLVVGALTLAISAFGEEYERFLLPVHTLSGPVLGAHGVRWSTELFVLNDAGHEIIVGPCGPGFPENPASPCVPSFIAFPAATVTHNPRVGWTEAGLRGRLVWAQFADAPHLVFELLLRGDDVPVARLPVPRATSFNTTINLLAVPLQPDARLRIYGLDNGANKVTIRVLSMPDQNAIPTGSPLAEATVNLAPSPYVDPSSLAFAPSYAELVLSQLIVGEQLVRLEIMSDARIWAFVTATSADGSAIDVIQPR